MGTYVIDGRQSASLPRQALVVTLAVGGRQRSGARLIAVLDSGAEAPVHAHSAEMLIVPRVDEPITIVAVPDGRRKHFEENVVLHLTVRPDSPPQVEVDSIRLAGQTVSGRSSIALVKIDVGSEPGFGDQLIVRSLAGPELALSPLADRARVACRGILGVDTIPPSKLINCSAVIDCSASMAGLFLDGLVGVASDIVTGVAAVVGTENFLAVLADAEMTTLKLDQVPELTPRVQEAVERSGFGVGADVSAAVDSAAAVSDFTVLISDVPAQLSRSSASGVQWITFSEDTHQTSRSNGAVLVQPPLGMPAGEYYLSNPQLIEQAVSALVAPLVSRSIANE
jgi:hypothetical protein